MPAQADAIKSYVEGKKYKKARCLQTYDYNQHKPHIVPSSKKKHLHELFCTLTLRHIGKTPQDVERHINGKKFKRALARWHKCQETGEKFVPRSGGRKKKMVTSDNDSVSGGEQFWSEDSSDGMDAQGHDDLSDLYPAKDFDVSDDEEVRVKGTESSENQPPGEVKQEYDDVEEGSDYDMSVLDNGTDHPVAGSTGKLQKLEDQVQGQKKKKRKSGEQVKEHSVKKQKKKKN
ncbi:surfeit locus protein 2-like isoform X3 [Physella acuta]|nr:surfeit locus protein 2-like isoform X3 [Physella acuta]XP_059177940.1 surfeit locus protein 2-like isoform X3 [Physella acuta]